MQTNHYMIWDVYLKHAIKRQRSSHTYAPPGRQLYSICLSRCLCLQNPERVEMENGPFWGTARTGPVFVGPVGNRPLVNDMMHT